MENLDLTQALASAQKASQQGREVLMHYFGQLKRVQEKAHADLVSEADVESEKAIRQILTTDFPDIPFLGEEDSFARKDATVPETAWVVDPLDGTTNYVHSFPVFCISIGLQWKGSTVVGLVEVPMLNKTYSARKGHGAFVNGEKLAVSQRRSISESLLATGFFPNNVTALKEQLKIFSDLIYEARGIRRAGAAAYDLCCVAEGIFDAFWEKNLKPWDTAAGSLMVAEAGGVNWTYVGSDYRLGDDSILSGNRVVTEQVVKRIANIH